MKRINLLGASLFTIVVMTSCGSSKPAMQPVQQPAVQQDVEINVPCSGPEFQTNKEYFRASSMGLSTDMSIAKKKAMTEARAEIATAISAKVKSVTDSYASSYQQGENDESKSRYQSLTRTVVEQELSGTRVICEKTMKTLMVSIRYMYLWNWRDRKSWMLWQTVSRTMRNCALTLNMKSSRKCLKKK